MPFSHMIPSIFKFKSKSIEIKSSSQFYEPHIRMSEIRYTHVCTVYHDAWHKFRTFSSQKVLDIYGLDNLRFTDTLFIKKITYRKYRGELTEDKR